MQQHLAPDASSNLAAKVAKQTDQVKLIKYAHFAQRENDFEIVPINIETMHNELMGSNWFKNCSRSWQEDLSEEQQDQIDCFPDPEMQAIGMAVHNQEEMLLVF